MAAAHNPKLPLYFIDFAPRTTGSVFSDEFLQLINARRIHCLDSLTDVKGPVNLILVGHGNGNGFQVFDDAGIFNSIIPDLESCNGGAMCNWFTYSHAMEQII
jgi:hypothetical protein